MTNPAPAPKKRLPILLILPAAVIVLVLLGVGGFAVGASQESHDPFCASCHTQPESTFYQRSTGAQPVDLASMHTTYTNHCIDCHSGAGLSGRISAEMMGASNAVKWYTGTAVQPAPLNNPIGDQNCLKCHADVVAQTFTPKEQISIPGVRTGEGGGGGFGNRSDRANHWHALLAKWQATSPTAGNAAAQPAGGCTSCHLGHAQGGTAATGFMTSQMIQPVCDACHQVLRREGG